MGREYSDSCSLRNSAGTRSALGWIMAEENPTPATTIARAEQSAFVVLRTPAQSTVLDDLRELVAALERRVPRLEREGECAIARDASVLKADALRRISALEQASAGDEF